jgi:hypothetical protein
VVATFRSSYKWILPIGTSVEATIKQGSMTLISYRGYCLGLTCKHVIGDWEGPGDNERIELALSRQVHVPGRLIFSSPNEPVGEPRDLAVFLLLESRITKLGKTPHLMAPGATSLVKGEFALAIGFPGHIRRKVRNVIQFPAYHVSARCELASDRNIILRDCSEPAKDQRIVFGGVSGGPIFRVKEDDSYELLGITVEGRGHHESVDNKNATEAVPNEFWIYGIPITTDWLDKILDAIPSAQRAMRPLEMVVKLFVPSVAPP